MIITLSRREMIDRWMLMRGFGPMRTDVTVTRVDGFDLEARMEAEARAWYLNTLDTAPLHLLEVTDIASDSSATATQHGLIRITVPPAVRRIVSVRLKSWWTDARIVTHDSPEAFLMHNRFARTGPADPIAALSPDRRTLMCPPPWRAKPEIESFLAVTDPGPDTYIFDDSLFPIPDNNDCCS